MNKLTKRWIAMLIVVVCITTLVEPQIIYAYEVENNENLTVATGEETYDYLDNIIIRTDAPVPDAITEEEEAEKETVAVKNINAGTEVVEDYITLEIEGVNESNIWAIREAIKVEKEKKQPVDGTTEVSLTKEEISNVVKVTIEKIKEQEEKEIAAIKNINAGTGIVADYIFLEIEGVNESNIGAIREAIKVEKEKKQPVDETSEVSLTKEEISNVVKVTIEKIKEQEEREIEAIKNINAGIEIVADYIFLEIEGVNESNIGAIREAIKVEKEKKQPVDETSEVSLTKEEISNVVKVTIEKIKEQEEKEIEAIKNINAGIEIVADYIFLEIEGVNESNIGAIREAIKVEKEKKQPVDETSEVSLTKEEISNVVKVTIEKIKEQEEKEIAAIKNINAGTEVVLDYITLGIEGVTEGNIQDIRLDIKNEKDKKQSELTISEIKQVVKNTINKLNIIRAFKVINMGIATCSDYKLIGVIGVTEQNIVGINLQFTDKNYTTLTEIQSILDVMFKDICVKINLGEATLDDYKLIGFTLITEDNFKYINIQLKGKNYSKLSEIKTKFDASVRLYDSADRIYAEEGTIADYQLIGVSGVTVDKLAWINAEVQEKIDLKLTNENVSGKITNIQSSVSYALSIYATIKIINDGKETCWGYFNSVDGRNYKIVEYYSIGKVIGNDYLPLTRKIITIEKDARGRDLTKQEILEVLDYTINNKDSKYILEPIRNSIDVAKTKKGSNLTTDEVLIAIDDRLNEIEGSYERIVNGNGILGDYILLQIAGVTENNLIWLNAEIKENIDIKLKSEDVNGKINNVQTAVTSILNIYSTIKTINDGKETCWGYFSSIDGRNYMVVEYYSIGRSIRDIKLELTRKAITIEKDKKGRGLTKQEILKVLDDTMNNKDSSYVIQPIRAAIDDEKVKKGRILTPSEVLIAIDERLEQIEESYARIIKGEGTLADYQLIQIAGVTASNLIWLNAEIQENIDINLRNENINGKINNVQTAVTSILNIYSTIKTINDGKETCWGYFSSIDGRNYMVVEYYSIGKSIRDIKLELTRKAITIEKDKKGRGLTKQEILKVLDDTMNNKDSSYVTQPIRAAIDDEKAKKERILTPSEVLIAIDERLEQIEESYARIVKGEGTLADYLLLQIAGVTANNLIWLNADIKENVDIKLKAEDVNGKINNVQMAVTSMLNIYSTIKTINDGKENCWGYFNSIDGRNYKIVEYYSIGRVIGNDYLPLTRKAITIEKDKKGRDLSKQEILEVLDYTISNKDSKYILEPIRNSIDVAKTKKGSNLTTDEVLIVIDDRLNEIEGSYERIVNGNGILGDYILLQIAGVTENNLIWLNAEIKENIDIKLKSEDVNGKINNVQTAVTSILNIYSTIKTINDGKETCWGYFSSIDGRNYMIIEYYSIGRSIKDIKLELTRKAITIEKDKKGRDLTKQEILKVLDDTMNNKDSSYVTQPIRAAIDDEKAKKGRILTPIEVLIVIDQRLDKIGEAYARIVKGEGTLAEYLLLQIAGVTENNLIWLNAEIKENVDIKLKDEDVNGKINNVQTAVTSILNRYSTIKTINDGKETCWGYFSSIDGRNYKIVEYYSIGRVIGNDYLSLTRKAITIEKDKKGRDLTNQEILKVLDDTINNKDSSYVTQPIRNSIDVAKTKKGSNLTTDEVLIAIDDRLNEIEGAYERIVNGDGVLVDYQLIQIAGVNSENLVWLNAEIKENVDIKLKAEDVNGKINNVQTAVTSMLSIYSTIKTINDGKETCWGYFSSIDGRNYKIIEYYTIGKSVVSGYLSLTRQEIAASKQEKGRDLTKQEILKVLSKY